jgi:ATP-binding cassette subfamily B protein
MKQTTTSRTISLFANHANRYKVFLYPLVLGVIFATFMSDIIQPLIIARVLQVISTHAYNSARLWQTFRGYLLLYALVVPLWGVAAWRINIWLVIKLEAAVVRDIAQKAFDHLISMSADFHANRFAGSLVSQANKLTGAYIRFADSTIFSLLTLLTTMAASVIILAPKVPFYAGAMLLLSLLYIVGTIHFSKAVRTANAQEATAQSQQTGDLADALTNVMAIKSFARTDYEQKRYAKSTQRTYDTAMVSMRATTIREVFASTITSSVSVAALFIAVFGVRYFGSDIATLFLIVSFTGSIGIRLWEFQNVLRQYNRAFGDASDMVEIFQIEPGIKDPDVPQNAKITRGAITLENVSFRHSGSKSTLFSNLNLRLKPGEKVGLVGQSGSGKTTLTRILLRYADIEAGSIKIDGYDIRELAQEDLRSHISYVPQEPLLFHRSLAENIAYGQPGASIAAVEAAAKMAHAHDFITQIPTGYDTLVGERGVKLSGGQRQRVAIARAMLKNSPILVLDEATSALDSESEVLIQDALWKLMEGRTALVIAHRLSTIQKMDRIIVMDDGKIVEEGTHRELVKKEGIYAKLWAHQSGGFLEE